MAGEPRRRLARARVSSRRRPAAARRRSETRRAVIILAAAALAIAAVTLALVLTRSPSLDPRTGCIAGQLAPDAHTVVLIDQTDPLTRPQIAYVKSLILAEYGRLGAGGRLTLRSIRPDPDVEDAIFSRCRVRRGAEVSALVSNPDMVEANFRRSVGGAMDDYLDSLRNVPSAPRSPILETVASVLDSPDFGPTIKSRRLVIVSDMAQNSALISQYRGPGSGLAVSGGVQESLSRDLKGVAVRIHYLRRPNLASIQTSRQRAFWTEWFERQGARVELGWGLQLVDRPERN